MRWTETYIPTLRDKQSDAELESHQFLLRGGYIRKLAPGHYHSLPLMQRVIDKLTAIICEEFNRAGACEISLPLLCPSDLWQQSGRRELLRADQMSVKDRRGHEFVLCGSHEEPIVSLIAGEVKSYRQLPLTLYQIGPKFRDELRTRFGLMRMREFLMADAYSFDTDPGSSEESLRRMNGAFLRVFERIGLDIMSVPTDSGGLGATNYNGLDFIAKLDSSASEQTVLTCTKCNFQANAEIATFGKPDRPDQVLNPKPLEKVDTPNATTIKEITEFLKVDANRIVKTLLYLADDKPIAVLVRGDRDVSPSKLGRALDAQSLELASASDVEKISGAPVGFAGPVGLDIPIVVDLMVNSLTDFVVGANEADRHLVNVNVGRDFTATTVTDITLTRDGDTCPTCGCQLIASTGLLVGTATMMGDDMTSRLGALISNANGKEQAMELGSYGIGISRAIQTVLECQNERDRISWPLALAPFMVELIPLNIDNNRQIDLVNQLQHDLEAEGVEVLIDDRLVRPGVKFHDADLLGIPVRLVLGEKSLAMGEVELLASNMAQAEKVQIDFAKEAIEKALKNLK